VVMNYMDVMSMDIERLMECSMTVSTDDDRLIPFCAYQLTDASGGVSTCWIGMKEWMANGR